MVMKKIEIKMMALVVLGLTSAVALSQTDNRIVLATPEFNVTTKDFENFVEYNIPEAQRESALAQDGTVRRIFENFYVMRAFSNRAEDNNAIDHAEVRWQVDNYREQLLMEKQLDHEVSEEMKDIDWEKAAREHYQANQEEFRTEEQVNADHILVAFNEHPREEARERAETVLSRLEAGESFAELAVEFSDDAQTKNNAGNLGFFGRGRMVKPFEDAVFALDNAGDTTDVVETSFGFHVIRLKERREGRLLAFEDVKDRLITQVRNRRQQQLRSDKLNEIQSGAVDIGLQVNTDILEEIETRHQPASQADADQESTE